MPYRIIKVGTLAVDGWTVTRGTARTLGPRRAVTGSGVRSRLVSNLI